MRLKSPAEFYIKTLLVHPDKYDTDSIKERLINENLDYISVAYIERLRKVLKPPTPFYPDDPRHKASFKFICNEKINRMFQKDISMKIALQILATPRAKEFVETMLLAGVPHVAISSFLTRHKRLYCTDDAIQAYGHYFWNLELLDSTQMRVILQLRFEQASVDQTEFEGKSRMLRSAYYKDARKVAADLPYSPTSAMLAQVRLGMKPSQYDLALRMIEARNMAALRAVEAVYQDGPGDSLKFLQYAQGGRLFEELIQMVVKPDDQIKDQLASIALRQDNRALPSIHQLSAGKHTVDVAPLEDLDHDTAQSTAVTGDISR